MNTDKLTRLLEAFYSGVTTIEEENELYHFFISENLPEELETEKRLFLNLYNLSLDDEIDVPSSLESKLSSLIDNLSEKEKPKKRSIKMWKFSAIAASLLVLVSVGLFMLNDRQPQSMLVDTFTNPEEAYLETQRTLELFSATLNNGLDPLKKAENGVVKVNQMVNESLSKIQ